MTTVTQAEKSDLRSRLQFGVVLALFLPVLFEASSQLSGDPTSSSGLSLKWGLVIAILIADYFFLESLNRVFSKLVVKVINLFIFLEIGLMGFVIYTLAALQLGSISWVQDYLLLISSIGIIFVPAGLFVLLALNSIYFAWKKD